MKLPLIIAASFAASMIMMASGAEQAREWKPATPGIELKEAAYDNATGNLEIHAGEEAVAPVLVDTAPGLPDAPYMVSGEVKYESVGGTGFLEMWNVFTPETAGGGEGRYFSRTLGDHGSMQSLKGTSAWREFVLPFNPEGAPGNLARLELNVVLPDGGIVWLRNMRLTPVPGMVSGAAHLLHNKVMAGVACGVIGALAGILAGLAAWCAGTGSHRSLGIFAGACLVSLGALCAAACIVGIVAGAWHWALPMGVIAAAVIPAGIAFRRRLAQSSDDQEWRRMRAADA